MYNLESKLVEQVGERDTHLCNVSDGRNESIFTDDIIGVSQIQSIFVYTQRYKTKTATVI